MNNDKRASTDSIIAETNKARQAQECKLGSCSRVLYVVFLIELGVKKIK